MYRVLTECTLGLRRLDKREGTVDTSEGGGTSASDITSSSARLMLVETLETVDGVRDKDDDAVEIESGVGPLEGEEIDWVVGAGNGGDSGGGGGGGGGGDGGCITGGRRRMDSTEVVIVSVTAVKLPKLVNGETLGRMNDVSKEASRPS